MIQLGFPCVVLHHEGPTSIRRQIPYEVPSPTVVTDMSYHGAHLLGVCSIEDISGIQGMPSPFRILDPETLTRWDGPTHPSQLRCRTRTTPMGAWLWHVPRWRSRTQPSLVAAQRSSIPSVTTSCAWPCQLAIHGPYVVSNTPVVGRRSKTNIPHVPPTVLATRSFGMFVDSSSITAYEAHAVNTRVALTPKPLSMRLIPRTRAP